MAVPVDPPLHRTFVSEATVPVSVLLVLVILKNVVAVHPPVVAVKLAV